MTRLQHRIVGLVLAVFLAISGPTLAYSQSAVEAGQIVGTVVQFTNGETSVHLTIGEDNPTVRDFLSRLPLTMTLDEYAGREKIGYFDSPLETDGSPGSDPEDGDLIYFVPWGNIGFYYNTSGIGYSDQTVHIGTYDASLETLSLLERGPVTVEVVK